MYLVGEANSMAIANWRVMFLICGGTTLVVGVMFIFLMPVNTTTAWFLNENERRIATERLALDRETRDRSEFNKEQVKEALLDPASWFYFLMALFICIPSPILKVNDIPLTYCCLLNCYSSRLSSSTDLGSTRSRPCWLVSLAVPWKSLSFGFLPWACAIPRTYEAGGVCY